MYEVSGRFPDMTWDDYRKRELKAGRAEPQMVGNVNLDELTTDSGMSSGRTKTPGGRWQRLRWMELFSRLGQAPDHQEIPPCWRWFPYKSWPLRISPPHVGSLDRHQYERLVGKLEAVTASDDAMCLCYYSALSCGSESPEGLVVKVAMGDLRDLYDFDRVSGSPSNIWPEDRSWLVWTDSDLNSTCVRGPWTLVAEVEADPEFETIRWP